MVQRKVQRHDWLLLFGVPEIMFTLSTFYKSDEWISFKDYLMQKRVNADGDITCAHCGKPIVKKYDCIGHHKIELTELNVNDYNISLNEDIVDLVHFNCHNKIHERYSYEPIKRVYIVYGSPCSGKSTWVNSVATSRDIILDVDKIWECISVNSRYDKSPRLNANVFGIRDCILEQIKMRVGKWQNAYIIGGYPLFTDRQRLVDKLGAELIYIEEQKEICLMRAENDDWKKFIEEWWEKFMP